ncbi:MAG: TetR/AcrR family transcriptional regulator [Caulobacteraceae bacterium]
MDNGLHIGAISAEPALSRTRARSRAALIEAAMALIAEKGFRGATLDEIAARAGRSKGAIYSNFSSKDELFLAVVASKRLVVAPRLAPGMSLREVLSAIGEAVVALRPAMIANAAFLAEFKLYALTHPEAHDQIAATYAAPLRALGEAFAGHFEKEHPPLPTDQLPVVIQALALGFMEQSFLAPGSVSDALIVQTFEALAGSNIARPR